MNVKIVAASLFFLQSCATVHHGRQQKVDVLTNPAGATVEVNCGESQARAVTPATLRLPRRTDQCSLVLRHDGYRPETVTLTAGVSRWVWGNLGPAVAGGSMAASRHSDQAFVDSLLGLVIGGAGFAVDALTGAMWQWAPGRVERTLTPE